MRTPATKTANRLAPSAVAVAPGHQSQSVGARRTQFPSNVLYGSPLHDEKTPYSRVVLDMSGYPSPSPRDSRVCSPAHATSWHSRAHVLLDRRARHLTPRCCASDCLNACVAHGYRTLWQSFVRGGKGKVWQSTLKLPMRAGVTKCRVRHA